MGRFTFRLPDIGEGIAEAEIVAWHVAIGDRVEEDGRLADMMTDKATVEMESPVAGKVIEVAGDIGDRVAIGGPLVVIETDEAWDTFEEPADTRKPSPLQGRGLGEGESGTGSGSVSDDMPLSPTLSPEGEREQVALAEPVAGKPARRAPVEARSGPTAKVLASPAVRHRARELGIDLADVHPAEGGRVRHGDLDAFVSYGAGQGYATAGPARADEQVRVIGLRRRIAENMAASKRNIPHFSYVEECDVTDLEAMRGQLNAARGSGGERPRLTLLPFLILAICRAVPQFPMINARYDDEAGVVTRHGAIHLGIATQTPAGLMVPVIRDAGSLNLWQLAAAVLRLAQAAREGKARSDELSGSTLTITSLGPLGGVATTPVINRPEVAIIGPNRIIERPMFVPDGLGGERLAKRKLMNLSISCDHRVVDGWDAASFVQAVRRSIEAPALLLAG